MNILYSHRTQGKRVEAVHIMGIVNGLRKLGHKVTIIGPPGRSEEHTSELQSHSFISYAVFCLKKKKKN